MTKAIEPERTHDHPPRGKNLGVPHPLGDRFNSLWWAVGCSDPCPTLGHEQRWIKSRPDVRGAAQSWGA